MSGRHTLRLLAIFSLGFLLALGGAMVWIRTRRPPPEVVLRLEVAPTGSLALVFTNVSQRPRPIVLPLGPRTGPEVDVLVDEGDAERLKGPLESGDGVSITLGPGQSFVQDLPLDEYVVLRGRATIHVERAKLRQDEPRLRSNSVVVEKRP